MGFKREVTSSNRAELEYLTILKTPHLQGLSGPKDQQPAGWLYARFGLLCLSMKSYLGTRQTSVQARIYRGSVQTLCGLLVQYGLPARNNGYNGYLSRFASVCTVSQTVQGDDRHTHGSHSLRSQDLASPGLRPQIHLLRLSQRMRPNCSNKMMNGLTRRAQTAGRNFFRKRTDVRCHGSV